ncbi:MAG: 3-deoxy-manno-octulosonate cytidylyltransferase [Candidatus Schekmanbacteria bacterium]|nr:3-deoxy-manno-octulosonate cytidylyltransferase [Candidatus Schekmanbacteria bacterium]
MKAVAIIPARYASSRFPGKPLAIIAGRPMIQWVYERTQKAGLLDETIVATDDERILKAVQDFGGKAVMTSPAYRNGSERIAEVAAGLDAQVIVNVQGDEPAIEPAMIDQAIAPLLKDKNIPVSTLKTPIENAAELISPHVVKVVTDNQGYALYFSRSPIPYQRERWKDQIAPAGNHYKHIGLYAYRRDFLLQFCRMQPTLLEQAEELEQLRVLENGYKIKVIETRYKSLGVDTPEDIIKVEYILKS